MKWKTARIYGTALNGSRCVVASVSVPDMLTKTETLRFVRNLVRHDPMTGHDYYPHAVLDEKDLDVRDGPYVQPCPHCGRV